MSTIFTILLCFVLGGLFAGTLYLLGKQAGSFDEKPISQATMRKYRQD